MARKPGRLKRTLNKIDNSGAYFFAFYTPNEVYYESTIHEVVIHRGKAERGGGLHPTTMEIKVVGLPPATITGTTARLFMRDLPSDLLANHLDGSSSGANLAMRGVGRIGTLEVEDTGRSFATAISTASWTARMLRRTSRVYIPKPGDTPATVLMETIGWTEPDPPAGLTVTASTGFDTVASTQDAINFRDAVGKFGADIGVYLLDTRAGVTRIMSLPARAAEAVAKAGVNMPLVRSQAIAPAQWSQKNDAPAIRLNYRIINAAGNLVMRTIDTQTWDPTFETVTLDWSYMQSQSNGTSGHSFQEGYSIVNETANRTYRLQSVKVDLLQLIDSDSAYGRLVAAQMLRLEVGDPIFLSGDWPPSVRGVHLAEGITETITPEEWTIELHLSVWGEIMGAYPQPTVEPRVWESATNRWNNETKEWNQA